MGQSSGAPPVGGVAESHIRELAPPRRSPDAGPSPWSSEEVQPPVTTSFSPSAEMLSRLEDLRRQEPVRFVYAVHTIADRLRELAEKAERMNPALLRLAEKFEAASRVGDLGPLKPGAELGKVHAAPVISDVLEHIPPLPPGDVPR